MSDPARESGPARPAAQDRRIKILRYFVDFALLGAIAWAFTVAAWLGALGLLLWLLFSDAILVAVLGPFFGVDRVRAALWGHMVLVPPADQGSAGPPGELIGNVGRVSTELAPEGFVEIDGQRYPARSEGETLRARTEVVVVETRLETLVVKPRDA